MPLDWNKRTHSVSPESMQGSTFYSLEKTERNESSQSSEKKTSAWSEGTVWWKSLQRDLYGLGKCWNSWEELSLSAIKAFPIRRPQGRVQSIFVELNQIPHDILEYLVHDKKKKSTVKKPAAAALLPQGCCHGNHSPLLTSVSVSGSCA